MIRESISVTTLMVDSYTLTFDLRPLRELNEDVLNQILKMLPEIAALKSLSLTCRRLREMVLPLLFGHFHYPAFSPDSWTPSEPDNFLPIAIRQYVRWVMEYMLQLRFL